MEAQGEGEKLKLLTAAITKPESAIQMVNPIVTKVEASPVGVSLTPG